MGGPNVITCQVLQRKERSGNPLVLYCRRPRAEGREKERNQDYLRDLAIMRQNVERGSSNSYSATLAIRALFNSLRLSAMTINALLDHGRMAINIWWRTLNRRIFETAYAFRTLQRHKSTTIEFR